MKPLKEDWKKLEENSQFNFHYVDFYFAKRFLPEEPHPPFLFLAYLLKISREGHLCAFVDQNTLVPSLSKEMDAILIEGALNLSGAEESVIREGNRFYLKRNWAAEKKFLFEFDRLKNEKPEIPIKMEWLEECLKKKALTHEQKKAILDSSNRSLSLILGGPGTGKTYTAKILVQIFSEKILGEIILAAPTGKATANLRAALIDFERKISIQTLHSLLSRDLLSADLTLIDEASMIDADLMATFFGKIKEGARLILLGDPNQLPPIESGNFFKDLAEKKECTSRLTQCLRSDLKEIVELGENVRLGKKIPFHPLLDSQKLLAYLTEKEETAILTPFKKGLFGSLYLNEKLCESHRKKGKSHFPIMITVNDAYLELFNGDVGILDAKEKVAIFGEKRVPLSLLPSFEYAFVISVHKSQGSEYDHLCILLPEGCEVFGKEMLYTAISRAKKSVEIFADEKTLSLLLNTSKRRFSGLTYKQ